MKIKVTKTDDYSLAINETDLSDEKYYISRSSGNQYVKNRLRMNVLRKVVIVSHW